MMIKREMHYPKGLQILYLGHASFRIITSTGKIILIDPWLGDNPACPAEHKVQDKADIILITDGHAEHMDRELPDIVDKTRARVVSAPEVYHYLESRDLDTLEWVNKGGTIDILGIKITMTNAFHNSFIPLENGTIGYFHDAVGYVIETEEQFPIYYSGDTCLFGDMALIGELYQPQIAILPIGDRVTMGPREAAYAVRLIGAPFVIPMHYGTRPELTGTPEAFKEATKDIEGLTICALKPGEVLG